MNKEHLVEQGLLNVCDRMVMQLILRAILLKLNSEKANELLEQQIISQTDTLLKMLLKDQLEEFPDLNNGDNVGYNITKDVFIKLKKRSQNIIEGIFSPPDDVAGIL